DRPSRGSSSTRSRSDEPMSLAVKKNEDLFENFGMIVNLFVILLNIINHSLKIYFSRNRNCRNWRPFLNFVN
ncbi:MAG: hypothetical protein SPH99_08415, partial [Sodaliphilus sp.]|nr:hypothetical protein [Sodaliphilus sp.]